MTNKTVKRKNCKIYNLNKVKSTANRCSKKGFSFSINTRIGHEEFFCDASKLLLYYIIRKKKYRVDSTEVTISFRS